MVQSISKEVIGEPKKIIEHYIKKWVKNEGDIPKEDALNKLFQETYPFNNKIEEVLVKSAALNNFYSTNIYSIYPVAKQIVDLDIDKRLTIGDKKLVNDIAKVAINEKGKVINFYSFATKYCSFHEPESYPIYDSYVQKVLNYYKRVSKFEKYTNAELRDYPIFKNVILNFRNYYELQDYSIKEIDMFLYALGRDKFSN